MLCPLPNMFCPLPNLLLSPLNFALVKYLVDHGAHVNIKDRYGEYRAYLEKVYEMNEILVGKYGLGGDKS